MLPVLLPLALWSLANKPVDPKVEARAEIQAIYDKQNTGIKRKNIAGVVYGCAPDFVEAHQEPPMKGQMFTLTQLRPMIAQLFTQTRSARRTTAIQTFAFTPSQVTVTARQHLVMSRLNPRTAKTGQLVQDGISRDIWVRQSGAWMEQRSTILSGRTRVSAQNPPEPAPPRP